jgi:rhodanese-related sulfurtransferase
MSGTVPPVSATDLYSRLGTANAPLLIDVRKMDAFGADDRMIAGALHRSPESVDRWIAELPADRPIVAYCIYGHEVSQGVVRALREGGAKAAYLEGGIAGWKDRSLPTRKKSGTIDARWVTREHPKIDRIACPWLISRFINPRAAFIYVPADEVLTAAEEKNATPYDIKGVQFGHVGDHCSFDAIIHHFEIRDPALDHLALIVRGADTSRPDVTPQCEGLLAISHGLSANFPDDHEMLRHGMVIYDALYTWCRLQAERQQTAQRATA